MEQSNDYKDMKGRSIMARKKAEPMKKQTAAKETTPPVVEKEVSTAVKTAPETDTAPTRKAIASSGNFSLKPPKNFIFSCEPVE